MSRVSSRYLKFLRFLTGVYPIIHTGSYLVDSFLILNGSHGLYPYYSIMDISFVFSIVLFMLSDVFKFCMWHKLLVINIIICSIADYIDSISPYFIDGYVILYFVELSSSVFSLGSVVSLFFKNRESNGKQ